MSAPKDEDAAILAWLRMPSKEKDVERAEDREIRRYLESTYTHDRDREELLRLLMPRRRKTSRDDLQTASRDRRYWEDLGYTASDVRPWLRSGAQPGDHQLVAELVAEGITATRAGEQILHPRTGATTSILDIARDWPRTHRSLGAALDDAGVERTRSYRPSALYRPRQA
jgi:hypothetical protein